jgi:Alpha galactosidase A C-terminal beta sandwich domain
LQNGNTEIWTKPITPIGSFAFAFLNLGTAVPTTVSAILSDFGLHNQSGYNVTEVFDGTYVGLFKPSSPLTVKVNPSGVFFAKAVIVSSE